MTDLFQRKMNILNMQEIQINTENLNTAFLKQL